MTINKVIMRFNEFNRFGWTEEFFKDLGSTPNPQLLLMAQKRVACLDKEATCLDIRYNDVDTPRSVQGYEVNLPGALGAGLVNDSPGETTMVAALITLYAAVGGQRQYLQRGLVDDDIKDGKITYAYSGVGPFTAWYDHLKSGGYYVHRLGHGESRIVTSIDGVTRRMTIPVLPPGAAVGMLIQVKTRISGNGCRIVWTGRIEAIGLDFFVLAGWKKGNATGGTYTFEANEYNTITSYKKAAPNWARTRKTGRPFGLSRGKASPRC